jgi:hypothetical protein
MNTKFPRSLIPRSLASPTAVCGYKRHCKGVVREVIGYLELQAKRDKTGERFVWPHVDTIVEHCSRYKGADYGPRAVKYAIKFLRRKHVISSRVFRFRNNAMREGFIVTPHEACFIRSKPPGKCICTFVGRHVPHTHFRRDEKTRSWYWVPKGLGEK